MTAWVNIERPIIVTQAKINTNLQIKRRGVQLEFDDI